jgi:hypothetical protein
LAAGEETPVNISVDKAMLVIGKVVEDSRSLPSKDYRVRFIGDVESIIVQRVLTAPKPTAENPSRCCGPALAQFSTR